MTRNSTYILTEVSLNCNYIILQEYDSFGVSTFPGGREGFEHVLDLPGLRCVPDR